MRIEDITLIILLLILAIGWIHKNKYRFGLDEDDIRALKLREEREKREQQQEKANRKKMLKEWDEVQREYERKERMKRK